MHQIRKNCWVITEKLKHIDRLTARGEMIWSDPPPPPPPPPTSSLPTAGAQKCVMNSPRFDFIAESILEFQSLVNFVIATTELILLLYFQMLIVMGHPS